MENQTFSKPKKIPSLAQKSFDIGDCMKIIPEIPKKFTGKFPKDFSNSFPNWGFFSREEIEKNKGKLLMLDIDFGRYCSLNCPYCFRKSSVLDDFCRGVDLSYDELVSVIDDARKLGLISVKICGAGEPTQNKYFLRFVRDMTERDVGVAVFTKGQVLGSDKETKRFYSEYGINSALELCKELKKYKVSVMLAFQSFNTELQDKMVGGMKGHTLTRNKALENLVKAGFNDSNPTRLALCSNPITKENYDEFFDIYVYARERNIYPVTAVLMTSGKQIDNDFIKKTDVSAQEKIDLYTKIYSYNIDHGIQTLEQIENGGVSVLPGIHPCNQIACGLYVTSKGAVVGCPGFTKKEGDVRKERISEIWKRSENFKRQGTFNCLCPPKDGKIIPDGFYSKVLQNLKEKFAK
ncbi:MAG: radical SAM protein [Candidatus Diapherotrites archaeon]